MGNNDATSHHHHRSRPRIDAFDPMHTPSASQHQQPRHQRARSLEHILDCGGDRGHHGTAAAAAGTIHPAGPNYWVASGATLVSRPKKGRAVGGGGSRQPPPARAPSVENMLDESSLDTNSTSIPSYCTVDRRSRMQPPNSVGSSRHQHHQPHYRAKPRPIPISSDDSSDPGRPVSVPPNRRIYKVNSFQRPPANMSVVCVVVCTNFCC